MPKKSKYPQTRVKKTEPESDADDWIIWGAWADRITFAKYLKELGYLKQK